MIFLIVLFISIYYFSYMVAYYLEKAKFVIFGMVLFECDLRDVFEIVWRDGIKHNCFNILLTYWELWVFTLDNKAYACYNCLVVGWFSLN